MANLGYLTQLSGFRTAVCLIWLAVALNIEAKPAAHWWARGGYRQPRWSYPCQSPGVQTILPDEGLQFTLADHYRQIFENTIALSLKVKNLMDRYETQYVQDSVLLDMLRGGNNRVPCLVTARETIPLSFDDEDLVMDKALVESLTAYNKLSKYVSYFDVTTKMYFEDGGRVVDAESLQQSHVTEHIYAVLCDLHSLLKRRHQSLPQFLIDDVIGAEECLANQKFDSHSRFVRDFAILSNFHKILESVTKEFEDLFRKTKY